MKRLLLLRHARSTPALNGHDDYERALTSSGEADAARIGDFLAAEGLMPDLIVSSSARRALDTARLVASRWRDAAEPSAELALYDASRLLILARLHALPDDAASALIVGHNPGIGESASWLAGDGDPAARLQISARYPTSGLSVLAFDCASWREIAPRAGRLERFVSPADLDAP